VEQYHIECCYLKEHGTNVTVYHLQDIKQVYKYEPYDNGCCGHEKITQECWRTDSAFNSNGVATLSEWIAERVAAERRSADNLFCAPSFGQNVTFLAQTMSKQIKGRL